MREKIYRVVVIMFLSMIAGAVIIPTKEVLPEWVVETVIVTMTAVGVYCTGLGRK